MSNNQPAKLSFSTKQVVAKSTTQRAPPLSVFEASQPAFQSNPSPVIVTSISDLSKADTKNPGTGNENENDKNIKTDFVIPVRSTRSWMQTAHTTITDDGEEVILNDKAAYEKDLEQRPNAPDRDAYERMPVSEFGRAMLRGMGWTGTTNEQSSSNYSADENKKGKNEISNVADGQPKSRSALLGIGAKDVGSQEGRRSERGYVPLIKVKKGTNERVEDEDNDSNNSNNNLKSNFNSQDSRNPSRSNNRCSHEHSGYRRERSSHNGSSRSSFHQKYYDRDYSRERYDSHRSSTRSEKYSGRSEKYKQSSPSSSSSRYRNRSPHRKRTSESDRNRSPGRDSSAKRYSDRDQSNSYREKRAY